MFYICSMVEKRKIPQRITKVEFARLAKVSRPTLYKWLRGEEVIPAVEQAILSALSRVEKWLEAEAA